MLLHLIASLAFAAGPAPDDLATSADRVEPEAEEGGLFAEKRSPRGVRLALRGVGELWHDTAIASRYRGSGIVAGVGGVIPINGFLAIDADIGYHRASGGDSGGGTLQLVPMALLAEARWLPREDNDLELFAGLGPAMVVWSESGQDPTTTAPEGAEEGPTVLRGARPGLEVRLGTRIDLGLVQPTMMPGQEDAVKAIELELLGARRFAPSSAGFNFNTWRVGAGIALRF